MSPRVRDGSGTSHLMSALCRSEERRERRMEETEMSVVLADPLISCWRGFFHLPDLRMSHLTRAQRGFFVRDQPRTPQNELIASTTLWTTDSPPGAMTSIGKTKRSIEA